MLSDTLGNGDAKGLVEALAETLTEVEPETSDNTLVEV